MKKSLIALALLVCAMAVAQAAQVAPDVMVASMKMEALVSALRAESLTPSTAHRFGSLTFARANKGGLARDSP